MHICLFDIDGTLLSSGGAGKAAMETALLAEFGIDRVRAQVPYSGRTDRAIARDLFHFHGIEESPQNWHRFLAHYLRLLPECLHRHQGHVLPGIGALLERLRSRGDVVLGLLTGNVRDGARLKLGHYGLFDYFAFGGFGDQHLDRDHVAREALAAAHEHLNGSADPGRVWVIGDTPLDVRCARAIGARVAAVATGWHSTDELAASEPDLLVESFLDPEPFFSALIDGDYYGITEHAED
jgi:phosphoglycolate phosphatase-like HAD superfamily hydrolase